VVNKLEKAGVIRRYHPLFGSSRVTTLLHTLSHKNSVRKDSGLYKLGHGENSIIWYWEFDMEKRYFHRFTTIDYRAAVEFHKENKFTLWKEIEEDEEGDGEGGEDEDQENGEDAVKRGNSEQREADTNVQDQDGSESGDQYEDGDTQDHGDRQDNREEHMKP